MLAEHIAELARVVEGGSLRYLASDFYSVDPGGPFDVVAYFDGFGIGSDEEQRRLFRRVGEWLPSSGCALIDILTPWHFARTAGDEEEFPEGSGVHYREGFDAEGSRMTEQMWRAMRPTSSCDRFGATPLPISGCCWKERISSWRRSSRTWTSGMGSQPRSKTPWSTWRN
jgi:hypothetical protein